MENCFEFEYKLIDRKKTKYPRTLSFKQWFRNLTRNQAEEHAVDFVNYHNKIYPDDRIELISIKEIDPKLLEETKKY